jgi:hypothetical protein
LALLLVAARQIGDAAIECGALTTAGCECGKVDQERSCLVVAAGIAQLDQGLNVSPSGLAVSGKRVEPLFALRGFGLGFSLSFGGRLLGSTPLAGVRCLSRRLSQLAGYQPCVVARPGLAPSPQHSSEMRICALVEAHEEIDALIFAQRADGSYCARPQMPRQSGPGRR